jgi:hypothetical protein
MLNRNSVACYIKIKIPNPQRAIFSYAVIPSPPVERVRVRE